MAVVEFVYADWAAIYPQFATTVNSGQATNCFNLATLYCGNAETSIVPYSPTSSPAVIARLQILYLLTAHIAQLQYGSVIGGTLVPAGPLVGRLSDVKQGSVSVKTELSGVPGSAAWFTQTEWGFMAWQAMAQYRTASYRASPGRYGLVQSPYPYCLGGRP